MNDEIFTAPWVAAWWRELERSDDYRQAAAEWEGSLGLRMRAGRRAEKGSERAVYLDLWHGSCREARVAAAEDLERAEYVLSAPAKIWHRLLEGRLDPIWGLMSGKLRLERGSLSGLTPHARAAKELLVTAMRIDATAIPEEKPERPAARDSFQTTSPRGLDHDQPPMRLWHKAKKLGIWDPRDIDFAPDREDWRSLSDPERDVLLRLTALFQGGEEAVTLDLLPLMQVIAAEGRLEEEIYLTSFLWEEAKHVEAFRRFLDEVAEESGDLSRFHTAGYRRIFHRELPTSLDRLRSDASPASQAEASVTYNMVVEGVLAETGYHAYHSVLDRHGILPGMREIVAHLKSDEARHLAYGVFLLSRLVAEHGEPVWEAIESRMEELFEPALDVVREVFDAYETMPFGLRLEDFTDFALGQFRRRFARIEKARGQTLAEVLGGGGWEAEPASV